MLRPPTTACRSPQRPRPRTPLQAAPWDILKGTFLQGTLVDPSYWSQQYFLAAKLKNYFPPNRKLHTAMELWPTSSNYLGYMTPVEGAGTLEKYVVLGEVEDEGLRDVLGQKGTVFKTEVVFVPWGPGKKTTMPTDLVDTALVAPGTTAILGGEALQYGLAEVSRVLKYDGRVLVVLDEEDEKALGGPMESILDAQDAWDYEELRDIDLDGVQLASGQIFRDARLRLISVIRDDCGLTLGVCVKREEPKVPKSVRKAKAKTKASASRPSRPGGGRGGRSQPGAARRR